VKRQFRLTRAIDFERVRQTGKAYLHPLVVLVVAENQTEQVRVGVAAGKSVGSAVVRNRSKRLLRESIHPLQRNLKPGWDMVFLARRPLPKAGYLKTRDAVEHVLRKAGLLCSEKTVNEH
jgi:ribonuclease P protein component